MRGTVRQKCQCLVRRDETGRVVKDAKGKSITDHRPGCKPKWEIFYEVGRDATGKRKQETKSGFTTKKEAQIALSAAVDRVNKGLYVTGAPVLVRDFLDGWLQGKATLRDSTVQAYRSHLDLYLIPHLGHVRLAELRHHHVERMFTDLRSRPGAPLSPATLQRIRATFNSALNSAMKRQLILVNSVASIELPSIPRRSHSVWTIDELNRFFDFTAKERLAVAYRVVAMTGFRRGEIAGLRWEDVDLDRRILHVRQQRVQLRTGVKVGPPKSDTGVRRVPIDETTADLLRQHRARMTEEALGRGEGRTAMEYVFVKEDGSPVMPETIYKTMRRLALRAGLPPIRLHDLRHTHASHALAAGIPMKVVQERLGHSSISLTMDTYTAVLPEVAVVAADLIAAAVDGKRRPAVGG